MGWSGWEQGTITLPRDAVPAVRKTLNSAHAEFVTKVVAEERRLWKEHLSQIPPRDRLDHLRGEGLLRSDDAFTQEVRETVEDLYSASSGKRPSKPDYAAQGLAPASSRTRLWRTVRGGSIAELEGRELSWTAEFGSQQHTSRDKWLAQTLFHCLRNIRWTRGSGGQIIGNDEMNQDTEHLGGGGDYLIAEFGPGTENRHRFVYAPDPVHRHRPLLLT